MLVGEFFLETLTMNPMRALCLSVALLALSSPASAQNAATAAVTTRVGMISGVMAKTAEKIPEALYAFKATPEVRSMGQLIGHIADSQFMRCAAAGHLHAPQQDRAAIERTLGDGLSAATRD
jgi:hypothetical protein